MSSWLAFATTFLQPEVSIMPPSPHDSLFGVLLYIGPDVFLPIASALAAVVGVALVFWQRVTASVGRLLRMVFGRRQ